MLKLIFIILTYFLLFPQIIYQIGHKWTDKNTLPNWILFTVSYVFGPFIPALIFYYIQLYLPQNINLFNPIFIFLAVWGIIFWLLKYIPHFLSSSFSLPSIRLPKFTGGYLTYILMIIFGFFWINLQLLFYPSTAVDELIYVTEIKLNAAKPDIQTIYQGKFVTFENFHYKFNTAVRPGIIILGSSMLQVYPSLEADLAIRLIYAYYFALYLIFTFYLIKYLTNNLESALATVVLFIFSWILVKNVLHGGKEIIIYLVGQLSLITLYLLIKSGRLVYVLFCAGLFALNILINFHGFVISALATVAYFLISFFRRGGRFAFQTIFIVWLTTAIIAGKELLYNLNFLVSPFIARNSSSTSESELTSFSKKVYITYSSYEQTRLIAETKENTTQKTNYSPFLSNYLKLVSERYLKANLQLFTQVGYYGFIPWISLLMLFTQRKRWFQKSSFRLIFIFIAFYIFIILNPLRLPFHSYIFVSETSTKYATFVLTFCIWYLGYSWKLLKLQLKSIYRQPTIFICFLLMLLFISVNVLRRLDDTFINQLRIFLRLYQNNDIYLTPIKHLSLILILISIMLLLLYLLGQIWLQKNKNYQRAVFDLTVIFFIFLLTGLSFVVASPGKVAYGDEIIYLFSKRSEKLNHAISEKDIFLANQFLNQAKLDGPVLTLLYEPVFYAKYPIYTSEYLFPFTPQQICFTRSPFCQDEFKYLLFTKEQQLNHHPFFILFADEIKQRSDQNKIRIFYENSKVLIWEFL